jgi:hypothetical protein
MVSKKLLLRLSGEGNMTFSQSSMGSYCSIHNDTKDETILVYVGANPQVIKPILWSISGVAALFSGAASMGVIGVTVTKWAVAEQTLVVSVSAMASAAGALVSASNWVLDTVQNKFVADFSKGGYQKLLPGQTFTTSRKTPMVCFNLRAWVIRIQKTEKAIIIRRANSSVWTGATNGGTNTYHVTNQKYFTNWRMETIPVEVEVHIATSQTESDGYTMVGSAGPECRLTEHMTWMHVDFEEPTKSPEGESNTHSVILVESNESKCSNKDTSK